MVVFKENFWNMRGNDGEDRSHIPPTPYWIFIIRIVQMAMALLILILTAVAGTKIGNQHASLGVNWFTFAWTLLHLTWFTLSILVWPVSYNYWAQLAVESLSVIFWLASWAALAAESSALRLIDGFGNTFSQAASNTNSDFKTGSECMKASAGLGALQWLLFIVTLVFFVISLIHHRKAKAPAAVTTGTEAAVTEEAKIAPVAPGGVEMNPVAQQQQQQAYDPPMQQYQQQQPNGGEYPPQQGQGYVQQPQGYTQPAQQAPYPQ